MAGRRNLVEAMVWVATPAALGIAFGSFLGGVIVHYPSWRWIFLLNLPVCIAVAILSNFYFRNYKSKTKAHFDFSGFLLLGGTASTLLAGLSSITKFSGSIILSAGLWGASLLSIFMLIYHARRVKHPEIDLRLFRNASYRISIGAGVPLRLGVASFAFVMPLILQIPMGFDSLTTGMLMGTTAVGALLSRFVAHRLIKTVGFRGVLLPFTLVLCLLTVFMSFIWLPHSLLAVTGLILLIGFSRSLVFTSVNTASYADLKNAS